MVSSKRSWEGQIVDFHSNSAVSTEKLDARPLTMDTENGANPQEGPLFQSIFENFRAELDEHHDRREKIIKASRDITALSKKMYDSDIHSCLTFLWLIYHVGVGYS